MNNTKDLKKTKQVLHKRNLHNKLYDFESLQKKEPLLQEFVKTNKYGNLSIDFFNAKAVLALNKALLAYFYEVEHWQIPEGYLCPPIPGRADYIHYLADLLASKSSKNIFKNSNINILDIGIGANCIYSILGARIYDWNFVGSDIEQKALDSSNKIIFSNNNLNNKIETILQKDANSIFKNIIKKDDRFDLSLCNPPFHKSKKQANEVALKKLKNLKGKDQKSLDLNFLGQSNELWCKGGELEFIKKMVNESLLYKEQCFYFTCLVSKKESLTLIYKELEKVNAFEVKTINMAQGQKISRFIAWTFLNKEKQKVWAKNRW